MDYAVKCLKLRNHPLIELLGVERLSQSLKGNKTWCNKNLKIKILSAR